MFQILLFETRRKFSMVKQKVIYGIPPHNGTQFIEFLRLTKFPNRFHWYFQLKVNIGSTSCRSCMTGRTKPFLII